MALDVVGQAGGISIMWQLGLVELLGWRDNKFSLMAKFCLLDSGVKGPLENIYGLTCFLEKHAFIDFLGWVKGIAEAGNWVIGGDFNLIANLGEKKGGR